MIQKKQFTNLEKKTILTLNKKNEKKINLKKIKKIIQTTRGFSAHVIFCDELAFMNVECILQSILPVAQQNNTVLLGTTTPLGSDNILSHMITTKDENGDPIIESIRIGKPCEECRKKKVLCVHMDNATAEGLSRKKRAKFALLYGEDSHKLMREYQGEISDSSTPIFQAKWLKALASRSTVPVRGPVRMIMMTIDPAVGGSDEFSVVCCYYDFMSGLQVIVLLDSYPLKPASPKVIKRSLFRCIIHLRSLNHHFKEIPIVVAVESAPKNFAEAIAEYIDDMQRKGISKNIFPMRETEKGTRPGVPKTNQNTQDMMMDAQMDLEMGKVVFSSVLSTTTAGTTPEKMKIKLIEQLSNFKKRVSEVTNEFAMPSVRIDGKSGGRKDDLGLAYIMNRYWYEYFRNSTNPFYEEAKRQYAVHESTAADNMPDFIEDILGSGFKSKVQELENLQKSRQYYQMIQSLHANRDQEQQRPPIGTNTRDGERENTKQLLLMSSQDPKTIADEHYKNILLSRSDVDELKDSKVYKNNTTTFLGDSRDEDVSLQIPELGPGVCLVDPDAIISSRNEQRYIRNRNSGFGRQSEQFNKGFVAC